MPIPKFVAKINKRVFNPREVKRNRYPVLVHRGRRSGATYRTPMDAYPTRGGYVCVVRYGQDSDWVRNAIAEGGATLIVEGEAMALTAPRIVGQAEALASLEAGLEVPKSFSTTSDYLLLDRAS